MDPGPFKAAASDSTRDEELWTSLEVMSASNCADVMSYGVMWGCGVGSSKSLPGMEVP